MGTRLLTLIATKPAGIKLIAALIMHRIYYACFS